MCQSRRQDIFKAKHICTSCQKQFKDSGTREDACRKLARLPREGKRVCPHCSAPMIEVSRDFRVPKMGDNRQWKAVREMLSDGHGIPFHTHVCGCYSGRVISRTVAHRKSYVSEQRQKMFVKLNKISSELTEMRGQRTYAWKQKVGNNTRYGRC